MYDCWSGLVVSDFEEFVQEKGRWTLLSYAKMREVKGENG